MVALTATPAAAHTISGPRASNYHSHIVSMTPEVPGITGRVLDLGNKFELTNRTPTEITVLGYEGEPYLRIGPNGVFENLHSQATYVNRTRLGGTVPVGVDTSPTAPPEWKKLSDGHSYRWHDHRIHWMSTQPPPTVAAAPGEFQHLSTQRITFLYNGKPVVIAVALDWVPGPSGLPWIVPIIALFVLGLASALAPRAWRLLAVLVVVLVCVDMAHAIAFEIPRAGTNAAKVVQFFAENFVSVAVWLAAIPTVIALWRRRIEALYGVVFVGLLVALVGGVSDLSALWKSQLPDAGPPWLMRVQVVVALGLGSGLAVGALVRMFRSRKPTEPEGNGQWLSLLVAGLSDAELARIVRELDADDVLEVALRELAIRARPVASDLSSGSVAFVVRDQPEPVVWSLVGADDAGSGLRARRGRVEPVALEVDAPFPVLLQLLAGTLSLEDATARALIATGGDAVLLHRLAPYLPETASLRDQLEDPASAP